MSVYEEETTTSLTDQFFEVPHDPRIACAREISRKVNRQLRVPPLGHVRGQIFCFSKEGASLLHLKEEQTTGGTT